MRFAISVSRIQRSLSGLVRWLYKIKGSDSRALAKETETALLKANPHLRNLEKLPEGMLIVVPKVTEINSAVEVRPVEMVAGEMIKQVRQALDNLRPLLLASVTRQKEEAKNTLELLESAGLKKLAEEELALKERLSKIIEAAKSRINEADSLKVSHEQTIAQLDKDLMKLAERFTKSGQA